MPANRGSRMASAGSQLFDLAVELLAPLQLVQQPGVMLATHEPILRGERRAVGREVLQPPEMRTRVGALAPLGGPPS